MIGLMMLVQLKENVTRPLVDLRVGLEIQIVEAQMVGYHALLVVDLLHTHHQNMINVLFYEFE